jgi:hypothetical protein
MDGRLKGRKSFLISIGRNLPSKICENPDKTRIKKELHVYLSIQFEALIDRSVGDLNIIKDPSINVFLEQLAHIEAKPHINIAVAIVRAAWLIILVPPSVIPHMKLQILQIRISDGIESIGFEGHEKLLSFIIGGNPEIMGIEFRCILNSEINLPGQTRELSPNIAGSTPHYIHDHILIREPL